MYVSAYNPVPYYISQAKDKIIRMRDGTLPEGTAVGHLFLLSRVGLWDDG